MLGSLIRKVVNCIFARNLAKSFHLKSLEVDRRLRLILAFSICDRYEQFHRIKFHTNTGFFQQHRFINCQPFFGYKGIDKYKDIMGSINCKEYATTTKDDSNKSRETTGSYQLTSDTKMEEYVESEVICKEDAIKENEMKQVEFNQDTKVLLIKQNGLIRAIGSKCSHYGAPLHLGALGEGRVRCPWHGACFSIETGDIEDFPGLDSIPCFKVNVESNGDLKIYAKLKDLDNAKRVKDMTKRSMEDQQVFLIIGGGPAGAVCAETLRQEGFTGRIIMLCKEHNLPYDRVKISKSMDILIETIQFRSAQFYEEYGIEAMLGVEGIKLDTANKTVVCSNGDSIKFDKAFIATGCRAYKPPIPGADLANVLTVRDYAETREISKIINKDMHVVCLGSSFISLESASFLVSKVKSVTLVGRDIAPLKESFGEKIGKRILDLFMDNGVTMVMQSGIDNIIGNSDGKVVEVELKGGRKIPCDLLIMGTGTKFYTDFLKDSGIVLNDKGAVDTDICLMTNIPDVYAGGDIANAPIYLIGNKRGTIGHYQLAQYHGRIAAINMAGFRVEKLHAVPFFFTMLFGKGLRYSGYGNYSDVIITGDLESFRFVAYFLNEHDTVVAVASCNRDPIVSQFAELQSQGKRIHRCDVVDETWLKMLHDYPLTVC